MRTTVPSVTHCRWPPWLDSHFTFPVLLRLLLKIQKLGAHENNNLLRDTMIISGSKVIFSGLLNMLIHSRLPLSNVAAAAKSLQSCPTLCYPIDGSPPGSPVPGILQARTLEWVAISFSNVWKWKVKVKLLSRVRLLATPWTAAYQAPPSMGFSRQEYWSGVPLPSPLSNVAATNFMLLLSQIQLSDWTIEHFRCGLSKLTCAASIKYTLSFEDNMILYWVNMNPYWNDYVLDRLVCRESNVTYFFYFNASIGHLNE